MGIKGLLQFLKEQQKVVNLSEYRGCTAAVDVYCWLHRAVYGCVDQIAIAGNDQGQYIAYCERYWNTLKRFGIKPILVFDGQNLPAKAHTEKERRERRKANRDKANALLADGKRSEARQYFERCIDITPHMAHKVIVAAVSQGVDCIVAPYEADAQLAFLSLSGVAQLIISEDSDLLCFGCERVFFKLDLNGNGVVQEKSKMLENKAFRKRFTFDHFVKMCILSGCDYIPSLPGIGLAKACKFISQNIMSTNVSSMLRRLPLSIKLPPGAVTDEYISQFTNAIMTFKHQVVFDPRTRKRQPLTPKTDTCCGLDDHPEDMTFAGRYFPAQQALQMALGNVNLHNMETLLPEIDPDLLLTREKGRLSIWHPGYRPKGSADEVNPQATDRELQSTKDKCALIPTEWITRKRRLSQPDAQDIIAVTKDTSGYETCSDLSTTASTCHSTVQVTPKPGKTSKTDEMDPVEATLSDDGIESLLAGPASPPKVTPRVNKFSKDKLRGIYHTPEALGETTTLVTSRYFGSSQSADVEPSVSQSEFEKTLDCGAKSSTQKDGANNPSTYKAKFLGALDELDNNPCSQARAFRWSKSSLHDPQTTSESDLSPKLTQQFKSPLLKSRLAQVTVSALTSESAGEEGGRRVNPFAQKPVANPVIRGGVTANPFKQVNSGSTVVGSVFGKAAAGKEQVSADPFAAKQLTRIGTKAKDKKSPPKQKLTSFLASKRRSPMKGDDSLVSLTRATTPDSPLNEKENCSLPTSHRDKQTTQTIDVESADEEDSTDVCVEMNSSPTPRQEPAALAIKKADKKVKIKAAVDRNGSSSSANHKSAKSAFFSKFTRPKPQKLKLVRESSAISRADNCEVMVDLT